MRNLLCAIAATLALATSVKADNTWLPAFDAGKHVYIDQKMTTRATFDADFEKQVLSRAAKHNLNVFVIIAEQGDDLAANNRDHWCSDLLHNDVWQKWQSAPGFKEDRILVLLYIRSKDSNAGSIAARSGSYLHGLGLDRKRFFDANGPILPAARKHNRTDPQKGLLAILDDVNAEIDRKLAAPAPATGSGDSDGSGFAVVMFLVVLFGGAMLIFVFAILRGSSSSSSYSSDSYSLGGGTSGYTPTPTTPTTPRPATTTPVTEKEKKKDEKKPTGSGGSSSGTTSTTTNNIVSSCGGSPASSCGSSSPASSCGGGGGGGCGGGGGGGGCGGGGGD